MQPHPGIETLDLKNLGSFYARILDRRSAGKCSGEYSTADLLEEISSNTIQYKWYTDEIAVKMAFVCVIESLCRRWQSHTRITIDIEKRSPRAVRSR